jgi:hypothetical protein
MTLYVVTGKEMDWQGMPYDLGNQSVGDTVDLTLTTTEESDLLGAGILAPPPLAGFSFARWFGQNAATSLAAATWTTIPLIDGPWQTGDVCFQLVATGQYAGALECTRAGVYSLGGAAAFDSSNQTGDRGTKITELAGAQAGLLDLMTSAPMLKVTAAPMIVGGEVTLSAGDVIGLQCYTSVATTTTNNPQSEWLSCALVALT